jgi:hypothetical protein
MEFVKLTSSPHGGYLCKNASNIEMTILGRFLTSDVGIGSSGFKKWGLTDSWGDACSGNLTALEKDNDYILLTDLYSEEETPTELKMTLEQFVQILTDWEEQVIKLKPKEVTITYDNGKFVIETKD